MVVKHLAQVSGMQEVLINVMMVEVVVVVKEVRYTASFLQMKSCQIYECMNLIIYSGWVGTDLTLLSTAIEHWCANVYTQIV